ncbi:MAG TPA: helix-turn-helix domain-containing protein [Candidatus Saccharimonadales bacterium]|jgi:DNA-binding HxlR family transcriptional regulator|nr:helix-turn-helix domain-containing protein [Candidatus Saccharimonadales bacterium]
MKIISKTLSIEPKAGCVACAMGIIGSKWTALILRDLVRAPRCFSELERSIKGINPRTLSQRLDCLEQQAIILRQPDTLNKPHVAYSLTKKGTDLIPILEQMAIWGTKYLSR